MPTTILLADDHVLMREGLRSILENDLHMTVVGQAGDGRSAVAMAQTLNPEIVIIDVHMPDMNGIDATRMLARDVPRTKVIALSMDNDRRYVRAMFSAGAQAYLLKQSAPDELEHAIHAVLEGRKFVGEGIANILIDDYLSHIDAATTADIALTAREREVLQLLAEGHATKEIATIIGTSVATAETHRKHIMDKLGIHTIAELTKYAIKFGLTSLE